MKKSEGEYCRIGEEPKPQPVKVKETTLERFNQIVDRKKLAMMKGMGLCTASATLEQIRI